MMRALSLARILARRPRVMPEAQLGRVELGDFERRAPPLERDQDSVYQVLALRFLNQHPAMLRGRGLVLSVDSTPAWSESLPTASVVTVLPVTARPRGGVAAVASADWLIVDRWLQRLPDMAPVLGDIVRRLRPGARVVTLFTGIARPEPDDRAPLWSVAPYAARRLHEEYGELEGVEVESRGNVTVALAWLYRLPASELTERELDAVDPAYPVLVAVTASRRS